MADNVTISSNFQPRDLVSIDQVPMRVVFDRFAYVLENETDINTATDYSCRFFKYRGRWFDAYEFERVTASEDSPLANWEGSQAHSAFDATLIRFAKDDAGYPDTGRVVVAHAHW